jgi:hypothetical protein
VHSEPAALHFADSFLQMLDGEKFDPYTDGLSTDLERIACLSFVPIRPGYWYDGVVGFEVIRRKPRQLRITGEMWVARGGSTDQWLEAFEAKITDMRSTAQGIRINMKIGDYKSDVDLCDLIADCDLQPYAEKKQKAHQDAPPNP